MSDQEQRTNTDEDIRATGTYAPSPSTEPKPADPDPTAAEPAANHAAPAPPPELRGTTPPTNRPYNAHPTGRRTHNVRAGRRRASRARIATGHPGAVVTGLNRPNARGR